MPSEVLRSRRYIVSLTATLVVVIAIVFLSYRDWNVYDDLTSAAEHARLAVDRAQSLVSLLTDAETGQRGFLLTGKEEYLHTYSVALPQIVRALDQLKRYTSGTDDSATAAVLQALAQEKLDELAETIQLRRAGGLEAAMPQVLTNRGKGTMDKFHQTANVFIQREESNFTSHQKTAAARIQQTRVVVLGGAAILLLLLVAAAIQITKLIEKLDTARQEAIAKQAILGTTLQSIGDAVISTDEKGVIRFLNTVAERLTGWRESEAAGRPLAEVFRIVSEDTRQTVDGPADKVLREGNIVGLANHTLLITRDGSELPIDDSGAPIKDAAGNIAGVVLVFRDIVERRRAERELADSALRYRHLFENNPQPMWVYDQQTLRFLAVNNAAIEKYGYSLEEFLAMTLREIRPPEDVAKLLEVTAVVQETYRNEGLWRHQKKDGTIITVEITAHPLEFDGHIACLVLANDVTERQRLERQFHAAQRMESIGRLAGGVAHDFNNLLTVINGYSEMLLSELPPEGSITEGLSEIRAAGNRAAALTQQLLAFSRRQVLQPTVVNVNHVVVEFQKMLQRLIGEDIHFVTRLAPDLGNIRADAGQLQQVIMNLAVNARDAMPTGGTLVIETANVTFDGVTTGAHAEMRPGEYVRLAVTDSGSGMTPEVQARLFEPFFTTKPTGQGTGLGLATVYGMVKQSGGWIWVYSEVGHGSTFKVYFPRTDSAVTQPAAKVKSETGGQETILVVEDQAEVRNMAVAALRKCGYSVYSASSGAEAVAFSEQFTEPIHLLLTDIVMPRMSGIEAADQLRQQRPSLRVLFMSGYTEQTIAVRGAIDEPVQYLQKPFTPEMLSAKVREVLSQPQSAPTILIVDDQDNILKMLRSILSAAGYSVVEASNGRHAMERLASRPPVDLMIMDILMPEQEGLETLQLLRNQNSRLKSIAMSGALDSTYLELARKLGASATLRKPIDQDLLLRTVREVLLA